MPSALPTADALKPTRADLRWLTIVLLIAGLLRLGFICWKPEALLEDRDLYWGIAQRLAAGDGFVHPELGHATAYRPPLYPLLLAVIIGSGGGLKTLATVQIALGIATVWLTWLLGRRLHLGRNALFAAVLVAVNPLLVQATSLAMTETLCTFLVTACLLAAVTQRCVVLGLLVGLAALCRPTLFAFAGLSAIVFLVRRFRQSTSTDRGWRRPAIVTIACILVITPWAIRNWSVFGQPIITTTHGGYTLLLGNNDEVYREEILQPSDSIWDSRPWQQSLEQDLQRASIAKSDELARDRWMSERAWDWIARHPRDFISLCWLRVKRFWNVSPAGADAAALPIIARWTLTAFYSFELLAAVIGLWRLRRDERSAWWPLIVLIVSLSLVHLIYWSNLRMRAPLEPVLALLAATSLRRTSVRSATS